MPQKSAHSFLKTRREHTQETAEDYTELILDLIVERGEARVTELARRLGVSHVTALRTVGRLKRQGLIKDQQRSPLCLTASGNRLAKRSKKRHQLVVAFLLSLGVPQKTSETDAEGIEHHLSAATLRAIKKHLNSQRIAR